ncbi:hypothetical protein D9619_013660 [Psilocybe cf. subviscida]|uniref:Uncharacterized protein n=1 Tax=Psilocybe cf. subviscida TaxID=2480587 RepID=A0A8H5BRV6_9AGAR|nr:hypothetical protein D9619_013660 [Psilocybe cf. subviscida]
MKNMETHPLSIPDTARYPAHVVYAPGGRAPVPFVPSSAPTSYPGSAASVTRIYLQQLKFTTGPSHGNYHHLRSQVYMWSPIGPRPPARSMRIALNR